jgi:glucokinase
MTSAGDAGALYGAVDLGGTKILTAVADGDGRWLGEDYRPTEVELGPEGVIARIIASLREALARAGAAGAALSAIGVAAPGPIDFERGVIVEAPNMPGWHELPLAARIGAAFGCPAVLENDANAAGWGEFVAGAGQGARHLVYLTVSTGIGGGLVLDGRLYRGATGSAGELGHIVIDPAGPVCGCGARGCLEALASGTALAREGQAAATDGRSPMLGRVATEREVTAEDVADAAAAGDAAARSIIAAAADALGQGLSDFVNIFNPDVIVIGGGAAKIGAPLLDPAVAAMRARAFQRPAMHVRVLPAALGDRAVAAGVLALARASTEY